MPCFCSLPSLNSCFIRMTLHFMKASVMATSITLKTGRGFQWVDHEAVAGTGADEGRFLGAWSARWNVGHLAKTESVNSKGLFAGLPESKCSPYEHEWQPWLSVKFWVSGKHHNRHLRCRQKSHLQSCLQPMSTHLITFKRHKSWVMFILNEG